MAECRSPLHTRSCLEKSRMVRHQSCSTAVAGKDRTGIGAVLILLALNVDEETILADYMKTNEYRQV